MALDEFTLIERYFAGRGPRREDVAVGVGDDAAVLRVPPGHELVATMDTLVEGVHFLPGTDASELGHKALAVSLSDLAAMGAEPAWTTLALTLPRADAEWLEAFCDGFFGLAAEHGVELVGGDTTRGPLALTVQAEGLVPAGTALRRGGARPGDALFVTGTLGDAGLGLELAQGTLAVADPHATYLRARFRRPRPRVREGRLLRGLARAAIDVSDGLAADLGHILEASRVAATVELARLPVSAALRAGAGDDARARRYALGAGEDYELCFSVDPAAEPRLREAFAGLDCGLTRIGAVEPGSGLRIVDPDGRDVALDITGYRHFDGE